ncbi:MAG: T9SS type A sorting domain-containing protein [Cryomorphaceae bacterium]
MRTRCYLTCWAVLGSLLLSINAQAQSIDLSVVDVHFSTPQGLNMVPLGLRSSMAITIQNNDSSILESGESISFSISVDGTSYSSQTTLSTPLQPGQRLYHPFGNSSLHSFPTTADSHSVVGTVNHALDSNSANDTLYIAFETTAGVSNDWEALSIEVLSPAGLDSFDIDNGTNQPPNMDMVRVVLRNNGSVEYLNGTAVTYRIVLQNDTTLLTGTINADSVGNGDSTVRILSNQAILPNTPDSVGTYAFCAISSEFWDNNPSNDTTCFHFSIVDLYNPNDPANWPWSIDEQDVQPFSVTTQANSLRIEHVHQALELRIFNLQGGLVASKSINASSTLSTHGLAPGIYMLQVGNASGYTWTEKFVKY